MNNKNENNPAYYNGTKIISMKDINGKRPEIFLISTNRTGGKTTFFNRWFVNRFIKHHEKFMVVYRNKYEIEGNVGDKFFKDIQSLFFQNYNMRSKIMEKTFSELFLNDIPCGYAVAINSADQIKKLSHYFSDTDKMIFDEFQTESGQYCQNEVQNLMSIHTSVARGHGKMARYVPIYMLSNAVTILNPYYTALGITTRLRKDTKFMRGDGWVLEQGFVESAAKAQEESAFLRAFKNQSYSSYTTEGLYLLDNLAMIEKMEGNFRYVLTISYKGKYYAVKVVNEEIYYVDNRPDMSYNIKIALTTSDYHTNFVGMSVYRNMIDFLRLNFHKGLFRFKNQECREAAFVLLSIYT